MKWIGQHIWDYVSKFRNDVYLEDISTGTIASGGNLGLDSNNKIVKANTEAGELSFSGSTANGVLTYGDATTINVESYLTFANGSNISRMEFLSNQDTGDKFQISTGTHGVTTLATFDDDATAADLRFQPDGDVIFNLLDADPDSLFKINLIGANNHMLEVIGEAGNYSKFRMYEMGGDSTDDHFEIDVGDAADTIIRTTDAGGASAHVMLQPDGDLKLQPNTGNTIFQSATSAKPSVQLVNANADAVAPELVFQKLATGSDGDDLGSILFKGDDGSNNVETFAQILGEIQEADHLSEEGKLTLSVASHDAELQPGLIIASGNAEDEVDVTIGNGMGSLTTLTGSLTSNGVVSTFTNATNSQVQIINTGNNAAGGIFNLINQRPNGVDSDVAGQIFFQANDDGGASNIVSTIEGKLEESASGSTKGSFTVDLLTASGANRRSAIIASSSAGDVVNTNLGYGTASTTKIAGSLTVGGSTSFVNSSGVVQVAAQGTIDHNSLANYEPSEHIRWHNDVSASATIHTNNITDLHGAGVDGSANQLLTDDGDGTVTSESGATWNGGTLALTSADTGRAAITLTSIADGNKPTNFSFIKNRASSAAFADDFIGFTSWISDNASGTAKTYAEQYVQASGVIAGDEFARVTHTCATSTGSASFKQNMITGLGSASANTVDTTLGYGVESTCTIAGEVVIEGDQVAIGGSSTQASVILFSEDTDNGTNKTAVVGAAAMGGNRTITLPDATGTVQLQGVNAGKQLHVITSNFYDDIVTTKHYVPISTQSTSEQTSDGNTVTDFLVPCSLKVKEVMVKLPNTTTGSGDLTVGIETANIGSNPAIKSIVETETVAVTSSNDNHIVHFMFDDTTHATIGQNLSITIKSSADLSGFQTWYVTTILEFDLATRYTGSSAVQTS